tara:strand:+ start:177 stop:347 length:171 start_codon:yes stop_codon:yes gene_type:complete
MDGFIETPVGDVAMKVKWKEDTKELTIVMNPIEAHQLTSLLEDAVQWGDCSNMEID